MEPNIEMMQQHLTMWQIWAPALMGIGTMMLTAALGYMFVRKVHRDQQHDATLKRMEQPLPTLRCDGCGGAGRVNRIVDDENDGMPYAVKCPRCAGSGRIVVGSAPAAPRPEVLEHSYKDGICIFCNKPFPIGGRRCTTRENIREAARQQQARREPGVV